MATQNTNRGLAAIDYDELSYASDYKVSAVEAAAFAKVVVSNDLTPLSPDEKVVYYFALARMAGLNPLNRPFEVLKFDDGRETLYTTKRASDELRFNHKLTAEIISREEMMNGTVLRVTARVTFPDGRTDSADGVVPLVKEEILEWKTAQSGKKYPVKSGNWIPLNPIEYSNAVMKAETKAKRRATLSAVGLGMLDESETETVARSRHATIDLETGEVKTDERDPARLDATNPEQVFNDLYEVTRTNNITDEDLQAIADTWKIPSIREAKVGEIVKLTERIRENPKGAKDWIATLRQDDEVFEGEATVIDDGEIPDAETRSAQRDLWDLAVDSFGWTSDQLNAVCQQELNTGFRQATAEQLNKLYADLVAADPDKIAAYVKAA